VLSFNGITTIYSPTRRVSYVQSLHYIRLAYVISILKKCSVSTISYVYMIIIKLC